MLHACEQDNKSVTFHLSERFLWITLENWRCKTAQYFTSKWHIGELRMRSAQWDLWSYLLWQSWLGQWQDSRCLRRQCCRCSRGGSRSSPSPAGRTPRCGRGRRWRTGTECLWTRHTPGRGSWTGSPAGRQCSGHACPPTGATKWRRRLKRKSQEDILIKNTTLRGARWFKKKKQKKVSLSHFGEYNLNSRPTC